MRGLVFWSVLLGVLLGVALESLFAFSLVGVVWSFLCALVIGALSIFLTETRLALVLALFMIAGSLGAMRMHVSASHVVDPILTSQIGEEVILEGFISKEPDKRERSVRLNVRAEVLEKGGGRIPVRSGVLVVQPSHTEIGYGQRVRISGVLEVPDTFETETGRTFDYPQYLAKDGIAYEIPFAEMEILDERKRILGSYLFAVKEAYLRGLGRALPEPHAALAGGITVGDKRSLGEALLEDFRNTGIVHIVVLSGYNVTIIAESIMRSLSRIPQVAGLWVGSIAIVLFAVMTGASATIVRASIMAIIALIARATGRTYAMTRALALAAGLMVLWEPHILLFDPGFQLSFLATLGLIYTAPIVERWFSFVPNRFGVRSIIGATLGTQLFVLPLLLYQMGVLSIVALPVNILILIIVPLAMLFSFVGGIAGMFSGMFALVLGMPAYLLLSYALFIVEWFAALPFAAVSVPSFSFVWVIGAYILLGWWVWKKHKQDAQPR